MIDYEYMYRALVRRLVEIADSPDLSVDRLFDYDLVARAHEPNIKEEGSCIKPDELPTDGAKITPKMLDSKADLKALIDDSKRWTEEADVS